MPVLNEWEERGEARGIALGEARGKADIILRLLGRRSGEVPQPLRERISNLPGASLDALADALFDFGAMSDAEKWLASHA